MQKKDPTNPRGYCQKSVVFLSKIKLYSFFKKLFEDVAVAYFSSNSDDTLREVFRIINNEWPSPEEIPESSEVELLGKKYQVGHRSSRSSLKKT